MNEQWKTAALGGLIGAALSLATVLLVQVSGLVPDTTDQRIHDYLMAHPDLVFTMANKAQTDQAEQEARKQQAAVNKLGLKRFFDPAVAYVTGPANAKKTFVEFFDYNCEHCRNTYATVQRFYKAHKNDTRFAFIDFPIFGKASTAAAAAAIAARQQGDLYIALHFALMGSPGAVDSDVVGMEARSVGLDMNKLAAEVVDPKVGKTIANARRLAEEALVDGTPTFIINGKVHSGELTDAELKKLSQS
jgi:protein-disulfide isomerase